MVNVIHNNGNKNLEIRTDYEELIKRLIDNKELKLKIKTDHAQLVKKLTDRELELPIVTIILVKKAYDRIFKRLALSSDYTELFGYVSMFMRAAIDSKDFAWIKEIVGEADKKGKQAIVIFNYEGKEVVKYFIEKMVVELTNNAEDEKLKEFIDKVIGLLLPIHIYGQEAFKEKLEEYKDLAVYDILKAAYDKWFKAYQEKQQENEQKELVAQLVVPDKFEEIDSEDEAIAPAESDKKRKWSDELENNKRRKETDYTR